MLLFRHFKGDYYQVDQFTEHTETDEILVVYSHRHTGQSYARPYDMFFDWVEDEKLGRVRRFEPVV